MYLHGQSPIYVSDDISRLATSEDTQEVALCARILLCEHDARITNPKLIQEANKHYKGLYDIDGAYMMLKNNYKY